MTASNPRSIQSHHDMATAASENPFEESLGIPLAGARVSG
jgi:hypothetical protein